MHPAKGQETTKDSEVEGSRIYQSSVTSLFRVRKLPNPKGPNLEKIQDRLKISEKSRLKISISLEIFNPDLQNSPQKIGVWWVARLKISSSLENFKILNFFKIWALRETLLVDVSDIFYFFCSGEGKGGPRRQKGGGRGRFFIENSRRGVLPGERRRGGRGAGRVSPGNLGGGGGG